MAVVKLTTEQSRTQFILTAGIRNLDYCLTWLQTVDQADIAVLDTERNNIIKAVTRGLELGEVAWFKVAPLLTIFSPHMERRRQWDVWNTLLQQGITIARQVGDQTNLITLSSLLARLLYRQSRFQESIATYRRVIQISRRWDVPFEEARACTNLGFFFVERERWYPAEVLCCHALTIFQSIEDQHGLAHTHNHLGVLYTRQERFYEAETHLKQAQMIWHQMKDKHGLMLSAMNLGVLNAHNQHPAKALTYAKEALALAKYTGEAQEIGAIHMNMGLAYLLLGQLVKAEQANLKAKAILEPQGDTIGLAHIFENLGKIYLEMTHWEKAIKYLEPVLATWQQLGNSVQEIKTTLYLSEYALGQDDNRQAKVWLDQAEYLLHKRSRSTKLPNLQSQINERRHRLAPR